MIACAWDADASPKTAKSIITIAFFIVIKFIMLRLRSVAGV